MSKHQRSFGISVIVLLCIATIESCDTPNGFLGECKEITECPELMARLRVYPSDPYLRQSACGHAAGSVINIVAFRNLS